MKKVQKSKICTVADVPVRQKVFAFIALVGLFACGFMIGFSMHDDKDVRKSIMSDVQCADLSKQIMWNLNADNTEFVKMAQEIFVKNCAGYVPAPTNEVAPVVVTETVVEEPAEVTTCQRIEQLLSRRLQPEDSTDSYAHLHNADTFSTLAERGCAENAEYYTEMALREIEIATALQPVDNFDESDTEIVIDVYKKLDMQAAAREFLNKMQRLTDPAIDFILQMEKVINE